MKLLVTGGAGFIGSEFVRQAVERGFEVVVVDKLTYAADLKRIQSVLKGIAFYRCDVQNGEFLESIFEKEKPDIVVHWAAESHVDRSIKDAVPFVDSNVRGTVTLLSVAQKFGVELLVNISTDEVYGSLGRDGKFVESDSLLPNSPYSASKASADMFGRAFYKTYGLPVITVRPSNNYGYWQYPEKLIPLVILKAIKGEAIPVYGDGKNVREWLFVSDCADAVFSIIEKGKPGEVYNVGSGEERENIYVVKKILELLEKPESLISFVPDRPGHDFRYALSTKKIEREIGWKAKVLFEEGIERTVDWFVRNRDWLLEKERQLREFWKEWKS